MMPSGAASFFPTAKELSSGVQWFKDHPVLAAAAATAVSVITYLNALELAEAGVEQVDEADAAVSRQRRVSVRRKGSSSEGKLSAAVSWCDEHGGSLTQVFEHDTSPHSRRARHLEESDSEDEARDDVAESFQAFQQHRTQLRKSVTAQQLEAAATTSDSEDTTQTESPQWGWYVPITPPQDQFQAREAVATCPEQGKVDGQTMRRTTSGQIQ
ncbi:hypothetical protein PHMEG_00016748 [Phytophthora megakarya]|uniref:Uncharacterized protein n=1 Tax=Phytophthora megakarya TaxID=4795 RepID=A0A225VYH2_9STRA|nr:hypothetical protein PHMEG_00016748 [Phytophthora megakarya]